MSTNVIFGRGNGKPTRAMENLSLSELSNSELLTLRMEGMPLYDIGVKYGATYQSVHQKFNTVEDEVTRLIAREVSTAQIADTIGCSREHTKKFIKLLNKKYK